MSYNSHTWELAFEDEPLFLAEGYVGRFSGTANMAGGTCESITLEAEDPAYITITPGHLLFGPMLASIKRTPAHVHRINYWREEVAA